MPCDLTKACQFFKDNMKNLPKAAEYIRNKLCFGDYESCSRFRIYKEYGENVPPYLNPDDAEEVKKAARCLQMKREDGR
uniref:Uncharacterized protein n=1 Tax=Geobacter sp. (strain M21) TaxID=443144 RepID=C6DZ04_GEOSM